ncbi:MAG: general secretion pathway protein GspC [Polyangiaceae bacterium]|nr:general secretion pathway protein GspC [Polyangiaceae bacterium]MCW5791925.1 general secretion pathway protein GspC [Polyangiaceae bacterium]
MSLDTLLKKHFGKLVLALLAVTAYLQAAGTNQLLGGWLFGARADALGALPKKSPDVGALNRQATKTASADPIIERNPFDSVTGPLNAKPVEEFPEEVGPVDTNPLTAPACDGVTVSIITESPDPLWSFAALRGPSDPAPKLHRVGDTLGDKTVAYIGVNPASRSPSVWLEAGNALCQVQLFGTPDAPPAARPTATPDKKAAADSARAAAVPSDIANKIKKVSDTEFEVDRSVVDKILADQAVLMKSARIVPEQKDGKVVGIRMFGIRDDTLLGTLGFQNGDRLESINGFDMTSPEKALEAYARLRTAGNLKVQINRGGKPTTVDFRIK